MNGISSLEELALETGSTLRYPGGRQFNSSGMQTKRAKGTVQPEAEAPAPAPAPAPARQELTPELLQQILTALNRPVEVRMPALPTPQVTVQQVEPERKSVQWTFEFERNSNGTIKRITASPQE